MLPYSSLDTGDKNSKPMANTSSNSSPLCHLNSITTSSTMTELFKLELPSNEILNSQISLVSMICRFSESVTWQDSPLGIPQNLKTEKKTRKAQKVNVVQPVEDGIKIDAPNAAASCNYLHVCSKCADPNHVVNNCYPTTRK
jgi:hypothetical protein